MDLKNSFITEDTLVPPTDPSKATLGTAPRGLRTFEDDIADAVRDGKGSTLNIALAEQKRKDTAVEYVAVRKSNKLYIFFGIVLFAVSFGVIGYIVYQKYGNQVLPDVLRGTASIVHPSIRADKTTPIDLNTLLPKNGISQSLLYKLGGSNLSTQTLSVAIPTVTVTGADDDIVRMAETKEIMPRLAKNAPSLLTRSLATSTVLGVYAGDTAEPFIVLKTVSYEGAFSGMLDWEDFMSDDLFTFMGVVLPSVGAAPIKENLPVVKIENTSSTTGTSTVATTSPKVVVAPATTSTDLRDITKFLDRTIKNKDMRVIQDDTGKIYLLYGFANRNTIIITTSVESFFAVSSRLR
jgi:hypothetical protein